MNRKTQYIFQTLVASIVLLYMSGCSSSTQTPTPIPPSATTSIPLTATTPIPPTSTAPIPLTSTVPISPTATESESAERGVETGVDELDRVIQIVLDGDMNALQSHFRYTEAECTFSDGLGGLPKCQEGEVEGETVEVLPVLAGEGNFIRKDDIDSWIGIDASDLYAVYSVSESAFSSPIYPTGEYAIAFINEARFMITTLQIVEGQIVRVDYTMGNPPTIRSDNVDLYLFAPLDLDQ